MSWTPPRNSTTTSVHTPSDAVSQPAIVASRMTAAAMVATAAVTSPA